MGFFDTPVSIRSDILFRAGEGSSNSSGRYYSKSIDYINRAHLDICRGNNPLDPTANVVFRWALKHPPGIFRVEPKYDTGTVSATLGSNSITFSDVIADSKTGWHIIFDDHEDVFRVNAHTAGTSTATIDSSFTGANISGGGYKLVKLEYELGSNDILRLLSPFRVFQSSAMRGDYRIYGVSNSKFDTMFPLNRIQSGVPDAFKIIKVAENNIRILMNRYMDSEYLKVEYDYAYKPSVLTTTSVSTDILVPDEWRFVIADFALALILKDKSDDKYDDAVSKARAGFNALVNATKYDTTAVDDSFGQFISREDDFDLGGRILRTESGLILGYVY